jgi:hypothetical protein
MQKNSEQSKSIHNIEKNAEKFQFCFYRLTFYTAKSHSKMQKNSKNANNSEKCRKNRFMQKNLKKIKKNSGNC